MKKIPLDPISYSLAKKAKKIAENHASRHQPGGEDPLPTDVPTTITEGATASEGTSTSFARADHVHGTPSSWTPKAHASSHQPGGSDALPTGTPVDIGTSNSEGTSTSFARADHVHNHPSISADLHPVYLLADGTRALTGDWSVNDYAIRDLGYIHLTPRLSNPALLEGKLWFRYDLGLLAYTPDGSTVRTLPYGSIDVDSHASRHVDGGADEITSKLDFRAMNVIVARATHDSDFYTTSTTYVDVTGLSVDVDLPANSNVLVFAQVPYITNNTSGYSVYQRIVRDTTVIKMTYHAHGDANVYHNSLIQTMDINVAAGTVTYKLQGAVSGGTGYWVMSTAAGGQGEICVIAFPY